MVEKLLPPVAAAMMAFASGSPPNLQRPPDLPPTDSGARVQVSPVGTDAPPASSDAHAAARASMPCSPVQSRTLASMFVRDDKGDVVARVQELVIEPRSGRVLYAAISFGRMVGMGDVVYVVPWDCVEIAPGCHELRLGLSPDDVKQGPRFSLETWPNFADDVYTASVDDYYREVGRRERLRDENQPNVLR